MFQMSWNKEVGEFNQSLCSQMINDAKIRNGDKF